MTITTCILSYNHPQITARCVQSCLNFLPEEQIVLFHNGSQAIHERYLRDLFPGIQHWTLGENRGFAGGVNEILRRSFLRSSWAFVLTNDCELLSLPKAPATPGFYGPLIWARKRGRVDSLLGKVQLRRAQLSHNRRPEDLVCQHGESLYIPGTAFFLHRSVFEKLGPFDEALHTYWEDVDYSLRAQKAGVSVRLFEQVEVLHHIGKTCHKDPHYTTYLYQRNRRQVSRRHTLRKDRLLLEWNLWRQGAWSQLKLAWQGRWEQRTLLKRAIRDSSRA